MLLDKLSVPKEYVRFYKMQPTFKDSMSDKELLKIALNIPIKMYLENYKSYIKNRALELNIYNKTFKTDIKAIDIINDGFKGSKIGKELKKRELKYINNFLSSKN